MNYNGWSNKDTYFVALWLQNDERNYRAICNGLKGIGTDTKLLDMSCCDMKAKIKRLHYGDKIVWKNVNMEEIKELLKEMESEE